MRKLLIFLGHLRWGGAAIPSEPPTIMAIRLRVDHRRWLVSTHFSGEVSLPQFAKYAREFSKLPVSEVPLIHFADGTNLTRVGFTVDQLVPHAEQMIARLAYGGDIAAGIILTPTAIGLPFAQMFRDIAADTFPIEVYEDVDRALDRLNGLFTMPPENRPVPIRSGA